MTDPSGTNQILLEEISVLQRRIEELEHSEADRKRAEEALRESEAQYRLLADHMKDQVWLMDLNLKPTYISPSVEKLRGYTFEEIAHLPLDKHLTATSLQSAIEFFSIEMPKAMADPTYFLTRSLELEFYRKDGSTLWVENTFSLIRDENGKPLSLLGVGRDITERKQAEEARQKSEENYRLLFDTAGEGILIVQGEMIKFANPALAEILGYQTDIITTRPFSSFIHPDDRAMVVDRHARRMRGEPMETGYDFRIIAADGTERWLHIISRLLSWEGMPASLSFVMDITERKRMEEALRDSEQRYWELSMIDDLTQLYNSRHFYVQLKSETERSNRYGQPLTLLLLDLDNFKAFNDSYGHVEGDHVLSRLGQVVKRCLRETDSAYRYGGEEFTIMLPMTTSSEGVVTAERIRTNFRKEAFSPVSGQEVHMTVSIGLAQYRTKEEIRAFVHRVDQWMYQGKKAGKDRVCCES